MQALCGKLVKSILPELFCGLLAQCLFFSIVDESVGTTALSLERQGSTERVHDDKHMDKIQAYC